MPWTAKDAPSGRTGALAEKWAKIANAALAACRKAHPKLPEEECAARAKMAANTQTMARFGLFGPSDAAFAETGGEYELENGLVAQDFEKDALHIGSYEHPKHGWKLRMTRDRIGRLVQAFALMTKNGVDVEVVVDHKLDAESVRGYTKDMQVGDDGGLMVRLQMRGEGAIELAKTVKNVSVLIDRDFKDGKGRSYGEAITHVSLCQQPVVPGQAEFVPVAASASGAANYPVLTFSQEGGQEMDPKLLKKIQELVGGDEVTEETALSRVLDHLASTTEERDQLKEQVKTLSDADPEKTKKDDDKDGKLSLDPEIAEQAAATATRELDMLVEKGRITPAVKDKLALALVGEAGDRKSFALSIVGGNGKQSILTMVVDALRDNDPIELAKKTGAQVIPLSREVPGSEESEKEDAETITEMVEMAGGAPEQKKE